MTNNESAIQAIFIALLGSMNYPMKLFKFHRIILIFSVNILVGGPRTVGIEES
jgi:hypothetical protein